MTTPLSDEALRLILALADEITDLPETAAEDRLRALHATPPEPLDADTVKLTAQQVKTLVVDQTRLRALRSDPETSARVADELAHLRGRRIAVLSGAGISVDAGFPTFRGSSTLGAGMWERIDPMQVASVDGYHRDPLRSLGWYCWRRSLGRDAVPTLAHATIAAAEQRAGSNWAGVHTQNVDGMHEVAGSGGVRRIHGSIWCWREVGSHALVFDADTTVESIPRGPAGDPLWRPGVVMFGDYAPVGVYRHATRQLAQAEVAIVVGTAAQVSTFWPLLHAAQAAGARFIEVNPEPSAVTHELGALPVTLPAGIGVPLVLEALGALDRADVERLSRTPRPPVSEVLPSLADELLADDD